MDVLTSEAIYQQENRKSGLLRVFQPQRASMSLTQLFGKSKVPPKVAGGIRTQLVCAADPSGDHAYVVKALCGGVEANALKASIPKTRNLTVNEAVGLVEQAAAHLTPDLRERVLQTWCTILAADQGCSASTAGALSPAIKARHSSWSSKEEEAVVPSAAATAHSAAAAPAQSGNAVALAAGAAVGSTQCSRQPSGSSDLGGVHPMTAPVLHLTLLDDNKPVEISFRELFLKSMALELVVKSFLEDPSTDTEEILLHQLLQLCLSKEPAEHSCTLVDAIIKLSSSMLHPHVQTLPRSMLRDIASQAVGSLKAPADLNKLDRQMEVVQAQLTTLLDEWDDCNTLGRVASSPDDASSMSGLPPLVASAEPLQESMRWNIAQKAWELASELKGLATQRHAILEHQAAFDYSTLRRMVDEPAASVVADVAALQQQLDETQAQLHQGAGFRTERFGKVKDQLVGMASEISGLEARRAVLLVELEQVDGDLRRLYKRQSELEEERNMFEEGSSLTLEGLTVQVSALEASQAVALLESTTLQNASALVALAESSAARAAASTMQESEECRQAATDKVLAAAQRFCELQHQELSRCIAAMKSSAAEITDISTTQMYDDILHQQALELIEARRQAAIETYLDAEMAAMDMLGELAQVQDSVRIQYRSASRLPSNAATSTNDPWSQAQASQGLPAATAGAITSSAATQQTPNAWPVQLATVMPALDSLRTEFECFERPEEVTKYSMAKAISHISSRHLSTSLSHMSVSASGFSAAQLGSRPASSKLLADAAGDGGDASAGLEREQSCEELQSTSGADLISYTALMEAPDATDVTTPRSRSATTSLGSSKHGSKAASPDRVAAAASAIAAATKKATEAAAGGAGALVKAGGSHVSRTGSDLDLQGMDKDTPAK